MLSASRSLCACCLNVAHAEALAAVGTPRRAFSASTAVAAKRPGKPDNAKHPPPYQASSSSWRAPHECSNDGPKSGKPDNAKHSPPHLASPSARLERNSDRPKFKETGSRPRPTNSLDRLQSQSKSPRATGPPAGSRRRLAVPLDELQEPKQEGRPEAPPRKYTPRTALPLDQLEESPSKQRAAGSSFKDSRSLERRDNYGGARQPLYSSPRDRPDSGPAKALGNPLQNAFASQQRARDESAFRPQSRDGPPRSRDSSPRSRDSSPRPSDKGGSRDRRFALAFGVDHPRKDFKAPPETQTALRDRLQQHLPQWAKEPATRRRLALLGFSEHTARKLLEAFVTAAPKAPGGWFPKQEDGKWQMQRTEWEVRSADSRRALDGALTRRFLAWALAEAPAPAVGASATLPAATPALPNEVPPPRPAVAGAQALIPADQLTRARAVYEALDYTHPEEWYPPARMARRVIHMHVGPTNSGKTHAALRALARAKHGVYASPLRMLAYEIFARLNAGRIVPLDGDPSAPEGTYARACNLLTGEEARVVDPYAGLLACTIEMFSYRDRYDVAVVDEIQMISDPDRGGAWSAAVLGLNAREVHLCGEEGAVPLVQTMLRSTGDEVVVHRYERLTPLQPASKALDGRLKDIKKGDCVVAFSRSSIFKLKERIEKETGLKCAVVYGRLPPEVRAEQAELFNDPNSGYDVLVGSDAIGMGLNLRIKRMVFADSKKYDGTELVPLSLSQLKQIAGRAGRYGLHGDSTAPGIVTTLKKEDLPTITRAVNSKTVPLTPHAVLPLTIMAHERLEQLLPPATPYAALADLQRAACRLPRHFVPGVGRAESADAAQALDEECQGMTLIERMRAADAPVAWRDDGVRPVALRFMRAYREEHCVRWAPALEGTGLLEALAAVRAAQNGDAPLPGHASLQSTQEGRHSHRRAAISTRRANARAGSDALTDLPSALARLETLYRIAVIYMWNGMRQALAYPDRDAAVEVKEECQALIEWCLHSAKAGKFGRVMRRREGRVGRQAQTEVGEGEGADVPEVRAVSGRVRVMDLKVRAEPRALALVRRPRRGMGTPTPPNEYVKPTVSDAAKREVTA